MVDDILNIGVMFVWVVNVLKENGVKEVYVCVLYGLLFDYVKSILDNVLIKDICIIDFVFIEENCYLENLMIVICLELMGEVVKCIYENILMSLLFCLEEKEFE